jgi:hypothetical protein
MLAIVFVAVGVALLAAAPVRGEEPMRLLIMREAPVEGAECIRGTLFVVRSYRKADVERRVRLGDTLELPRVAAEGEGSLHLPAGRHAASAHENGALGWRIELPDGTPIRAHPPAGAPVEEGGVLLGRRAGKPSGACTLESDRLEDGEVVTRRLQRMCRWSESPRPIQVMVR